MSSASVLVVDDEPSIRNMLRTMLEVEGFQVDTAADGATTLDRLRAGAAPQLMVLDVNMPGLDGLQTLEQVRQVSPATKVVMLSCVSDTRKVVHAMQLGAEDYLTKPFQQRDLINTLQRSLAALGRLAWLQILRSDFSRPREMSHSRPSHHADR